MHHFFPVLNVLGFTILLFSFTLAFPAAIAYFGRDAALQSFEIAFGIAVAIGVGLWATTHRYKRELQPRDGFLLVVLVWATLPAIAGLPLMLQIDGLSFTDAYFECVSGLTTTGSTVLSDLDKLPPSINVWRSTLVWMGGMGIIVLAVAILPLLGVGGMQMYRAETPGPMKDSKLTPRITETAKGLWAVYFVITLACILSFRAVGMTWMDALIHAFSTMGLGGFSSHDASFGHFNSPEIEGVTIAFMLIAGINFSTHFVAFRQKSLNAYISCPEAKWFVLIMVLSSALIGAYLFAHDVYPSVGEAMRHAFFNTISIATTTGFASVDYNLWPMFAPALMILLSCIATSSGSTGGGIKLIRLVLLLKQAKRELLRIMHPRAISPVRIGREVIPHNVILSVLAFMMLYGSAIIGLTMLLLFTGLDVVTATTAVIASINNMGPGLNLVGPSTTYAVLSDFQTWVCTFAMLLGRLELMTLLVVFTPWFWRK